MRHFFLDTNIVLDLLAYRAPFALAAADLFQLADEGKCALYISSLSFSQLHYLLRKIVGDAASRKLLLEVAQGHTLIPLDEPGLLAALQSNFSDFEDALQYCAARTVPAIEAIVTRDPKGFAASTLPVLTPPQALAQLGS